VTDAALVLGMLGEGRFAPDFCLDVDAAATVLQAVAQQLDRTVEQLAVGIVALASASMADTIRELTVEQGIDPQSLKLMAFGGAGPMLACQLARELGMGHVVVPLHPGNFSAWGLLGADVVRTVSRTLLSPLDDSGIAIVEKAALAMFEEVERRSQDRRLLEGATREFGISLRFVGQEHSVTVPASANHRLIDGGTALEQRFRAAYEKTFGISLDNPVEIVALRVSIRRSMNRNIPPVESSDRDSAEFSKHTMYSFALGSRVEAGAVQRAALSQRTRYSGPAVIYEDTATTYVDADFWYELDAYGCLHLIHKKDSR
jgi:N-methylhydantoinase A